MNFKDKIEKIKNIFNEKISLKEATLEDGTPITCDSLEEGSIIYTVVDDEKLPLPEGQYVIEDKNISVDKDGKILIIEDKDKDEDGEGSKEENQEVIYDYKELVVGEPIKIKDGEDLEDGEYE
ncbi:MAG: hypothetical protein ACOCRX_08235, partial [Candidatus Woesearchaeota archaeon]